MSNSLFVTDDDEVMASCTNFQEDFRDGGISLAYLPDPVCRAIDQSASSGKRQMYTSQQWERMRPVIARLYIDLGMTLQEVMEEIRVKYRFYAT